MKRKSNGKREQLLHHIHQRFDTGPVILRRKNEIGGLFSRNERRHGGRYLAANIPRKPKWNVTWQYVWLSGAKNQTFLQLYASLNSNKMVSLFHLKLRPSNSEKLKLAGSCGRFLQ
jgi:hypothetical protein